MALLESAAIKLDIPAPDFDLPGIDGKIYSLQTLAGAKVLVIIFMCNHCPYVQACWERLIKLQSKYEKRGVQFVGINANDSESYPEDSFENMKISAHERGHNFPYLRDESQQVARSFGATCTPDIFLYDEHRRLAYHGRIDDNWRDGSKATQHDLDDAIALILKRKPVSTNQKPSIGCSIKWKK